MPDGYRRDKLFALTYLARSELSEADAMLARLLTLAEKPDSDPPVAMAIAEVYAARHDPTHAFQWLDTARRLCLASQVAGFVPRWTLHEDMQLSPQFKSLHADPCWRELLAKLAI
jgi:hypothetical protein